MTTTTNTVRLTAAKGSQAGKTGEVITTFGKQSVVISGLGVVYRRSLTVQSQRDLVAWENGVTWGWLRETMSESEALAWLGI